MVDFAYRTASRTISDKLEAKLATVSDKGIPFFCPNKNCNAALTIRNIGDDAYFAAKPSKAHINGCSYATASNNYHIYNEAQFDFNKFINNLCKLTGSNSSIIHSTPSNISNSPSTSIGAIQTLRLLYSMCKDKNIDDTYNGNTIGSMLLDNRSLSKYFSQGVWGNKIIKCKSKSYDNNNKEIWLKVSDGTQTYQIILTFEYDELYKKERQRIWVNSITANFQNVDMVIAGYWSTYNNKKNHFTTKITSSKQIFIL